MTPADQVAALERAGAGAARAADVIAELGQRLEDLGGAVLVEASRVRRAGFQRCAGCSECAAPLPVLAGDV